MLTPYYFILFIERFFVKANETVGVIQKLVTQPVINNESTLKPFNLDERVDL